MNKYFDERSFPTPDPGWDIDHVCRGSELNYFGVSPFEERKLLTACINVMMAGIGASSAENKQEYKKCKTILTESLIVVRDFAARYTLDGLIKGYPEMMPVWDKLKTERAESFNQWVKDNC